MAVKNINPRIKGRAMRLGMGFLLPITIGALCIYLASIIIAIAETALSFEFLNPLNLVLVFFAGCFFMGIQALTFTIIMELFITPKWAMLPACRMGGFLGLLASLSMPLPLGKPFLFDSSSRDLYWLIPFCLAGIIAGIVSAALPKRHYNKHHPIIIADKEP